MKLRQALIIVDMQNDFCPEGSLAVPEGDRIVPVLNKYIGLCQSRKIPVFATRDWHPLKTRHFKKFGGLWPRHCVRLTKGAQFHPGLKLPKNAIIVSKGMDPELEGYSAFDAVNEQGVSLLNLLKILRVERLLIGGLATDYCIKFSVLDALKKGFRVGLLMDAVKGVNIKTDDSKKAIILAVKKGAKRITINRL
ncbi:MAG: bifunctional nicotinamidase/pyrazinamidase [Candidatus Omnitrophota bacterium]